MKKVIRVFVVVMAIITSVMVFASCEEEHTHQFSTEWAIDATDHWHSASCEHTTEISDKAPHSWGEPVLSTSPTCKDAGVNTYTCIVCSATKTEAVSKIDTHTWNAGEITTPATCTAEGVKTFTCTVCSATKTEAVAKSAHTYLDGKTQYVVESAKLYTQKLCDACNTPDTAKAEVANAIVATTNEQAQSALDGDINGKMLVLSGDSDFGTLYVRIRTNVDQKLDIAGGYNNATYLRDFKNVTILGMNGAKLDDVKFEACEYYYHDEQNPGNWHSQQGTENVLYALMEVSNFTIKDIAFTGEKRAFVFEGGHNVKINGFTIDSCSISDNNLFVISGGATEFKDKTTEDVVFLTSSKNIVIKNCVIKNANQPIELRETENVTISGNTFENIVNNCIALLSAKTKYTGTILIDSNSTNTTGRLLRMTNLEAGAELVLSNNKMVNYVEADPGNDPEVIKVTASDGGVVTLTNNTLDAVAIPSEKIKIPAQE